MNCPKCGAASRAGAKFCGNCGAKLVAACPQCGAVVPPGAKFCAQCGKPVAATALPRDANGALALGTLLDRRYRVQQLLGFGGFGAVYLADDLRLTGTRCAVKESFDRAPDARRQFEREARLLRQLTHPQLVHVTDYFCTPADELFLVMDYIAGDDLTQVLANAVGFLPEAQVVDWVVQVCGVLEYMHTWADPQTGQPAPIIHRDLKPGNLKLRPDGKIMVIDLGIAKVKQLGSKTTKAARAVSPPYSPLEQYGQGTDERSDIYALGVTMYHLLTQQLPPEATDRVRQQLVPPRQHNPQISAMVEQVILRALELNADQRYQTVAEMRAALTGGAGAQPAAGASGADGAAPKAGEIRVFDGVEMVYIPAGEFTMGSDSLDGTCPACGGKNEAGAAFCENCGSIIYKAAPAHKVYLAGYWIDRYPVTNEEYKRFVDATGYRCPEHWEYGRYPQGRAKHPVVFVSWDDAMAYAQWKGKRLPTEAEWEKAARGTDARTYPWGNDWNPYNCNSSERGPGDTTPVGQYSPAGDSPYGVADMAGNVWEWCADWYAADYYVYSPPRNPTGPATGQRRVIRGGSWNDIDNDVRSASRGNFTSPTNTYNDVGLRCLQ